MADINNAKNAFPYARYPEVEPPTKVVVFRALFSGVFAEAEAISNAAENLVEIHISDAPSGLLLLCQLLHFQGDLDKVRHERFFDLALVINNYDCAQALRHVITGKFATLDLCGDDQVEHVCYLAAALILDQPKFFRGLSKEIVTHYEHGPLELDDSRLDVLPDKILASVQAQKALAGQELVCHLSIFITNYHTAAFALNATAYSNELTQTMLDCDLWPLDLKEYPMGYRSVSCENIMFHIMRADNLEPQPQPQPQFNDCVDVDAFHFIQSEHLRRSARGASQKPLTGVVKPLTKFDLVLIVERVERICLGLCLNCLNCNDRCRVRHTDPFSNDLWDRYTGSNDGPDYGKGSKRPVNWESIW